MCSGTEKKVLEDAQGRTMIEGWQERMNQKTGTIIGSLEETFQALL